MQIIAEFERQLAKDVREDDIGGSISAAIVRRDELLWARAFGPQTRRGARAASPETIYRVGSLTKSFTALLMMLFVQDGLLELDQPVEECLPEVRDLAGYSAATRITFRQLASHTAGLAREPALEKADVGPLADWEQNVLKAIRQTTFEFKPGERLSYSNIGYGILGVALGRAGRAPFTELVTERILGLLGMGSTFFKVPSHRQDDLAQGIGGGPFGDAEPDLDGPEKEHRGRGYKVPNGGLYSTTADLARFLRCAMGYTDLLEQKYLDLMQRNQTPETSYRHYGLGFELYRDPAVSIAGHSGGLPGYSADCQFEKERHYGVIILRNYNWGTTSWDIGPKVVLRKLAEADRRPHT